ncbi:MAG TPA: S8 family serine peptidase [Acidimicrobiales bacterium]|nr:S8 family serine peptidase [Acidimicrobiales bacterium]
MAGARLLLGGMGLALRVGAAIVTAASATNGVLMPVAAGQARPAEVVPNNPCYEATCGPDHPVVEYPTLGAGITEIHPDGQTNLWAVNASQAWAVTKGSASIFVAVLDTGVNPAQPQLTQKVIVGPNFCSQDLPLCSGSYDQNGHGTFVTGLIAAADNDGLGIAGLGWNTKVIDIKVLDSTGRGDIPDEVQGIRYAIATPGVRVINLSWADTPCAAGAPLSSCSSPEEQQAIESAVAHGIVVVAAPGNNDSDLPVYPASYPGVLSVAASTDQGVVDPDNGTPNGSPYADFSDYGNDANIAAPGIGVLSTWYDGNYAVQSGTSFAAPLVAAAAALVMAADPKLTGPQVATLLIETSSPLSTGGVTINGGFLNVEAAVQAAAAGEVPATLYGYQLISANGTAYNSGFVAAQEPPSGAHLDGPVVAGAETRGGLGYWMVTAKGEVIGVGGAHVYGGLTARPALSPVVGIAGTPDGRGYWLLERDGAVLAFGDARLYGPVTGGSLAAPAAAIAATPDGRGYWVTCANGAVLAWGDARYYGSTAKIHLNRPIVSMAATPDGHGYWLVGSDGGIFNFGDAGWFGPSASQKPREPVIGLVASPDGFGYWLAGEDGQVWHFGSAPYEPPEPAASKPGSIVAITS